MSLSDIRREYAREELDERSVDADPLRQLIHWLDEASAAQVLEPTAMTLATATRTGIPSARIVLLKGANETGLVFFTDTRSRKGRELAENPQAALCFWWGELERQVGVVGAVYDLDAEAADFYFRSRPEGSRISAWASHQSTVVPDRESLAQAWETAARRYSGTEIPRPPYWSGYRVVPHEYEFWQGRPNRLHDRLRYRREEHVWIVERLSP